MLEAQLIAAKKEELRNYLSIARTAFGPIYGNALPDDENAKAPRYPDTVCHDLWHGRVLFRL